MNILVQFIGAVSTMNIVVGLFANNLLVFIFGVGMLIGSWSMAVLHDQESLK